MFSSSFLQRLQLRCARYRANHGHAVRRPHFETLEDRSLLSFTPVTGFPVGTEPRAVVTADFNNDGRLDLAAANYGAGSVSVLLGNGSGAFGAAITSTAGANPVSIAVGDFNADGKLDLATANEGDNNVSVLLGNGNGSFQAPTNMLSGPTPNSVAVGDFNNDGKLDLVATANWYFPYSYPQGLAAVFLGHGDGSFSAPIFGNAGFDRPINSEAVGDFNNDGKLDLVISDNAYAEIQVLPGNGQGLLNPSGSLGTSARKNAVSMVVGDVNRSEERRVGK